MSEFLDELARTMAKPMPRSRALRTIGITLAAATVPGFRPRLAAAAASRLGTEACPVPDCPPCPTGNNTYLCCLPITGNDGKIRCVGFGCCPDGKGRAPFHICCKTASTTICCNSQTHTCGPPGINDTATCKCKKPCGTGCCEPDQECASLQLSAGGKPYRRCLDKCKRGSRRCPGALGCCPADQECCGSGSAACCGPNQTCVRGLNARGQALKLCSPKCKPGERRCNFGCCRRENRSSRKLPNGKVVCVCSR